MVKTLNGISKNYFFGKLSKKGEFKYLGKNFLYTGKIFYKNNEEYCVWNNGVFSKTIK